MQTTATSHFRLSTRVSVTNRRFLARAATAPERRYETSYWFTVAHWKNDEIIEEKLFYDLVGLLKQTIATVR